MSEKLPQRRSRHGWVALRLITDSETAEIASALAPRYGVEVKVYGREGDEYTSPIPGTIYSKIYNVEKGRAHIQISNAPGQDIYSYAFQYFWERVMKWGKRKSFKRVKKA